MYTYYMSSANSVMVEAKRLCTLSIYRSRETSVSSINTNNNSALWYHSISTADESAICYRPGLVYFTTIEF